MRIAIDIREACKSKPTGKGIWTRGCVSELLKHKQNTYILLTHSQHVPNEWKEYENVEIHSLPEGILWHIHAARHLLLHKPDMYLSTTSFIVPWLIQRSVPYTLITHDLIAFLKEPHNRKAKCIERLLLGSVVKKARAICCISEHTKKDLCSRFPKISEDAVSVIHAGCTFTDVDANAGKQKTIFYISTLCPRKNQLRLMEAYAKLPSGLREEYTLVLAGGRGWGDKEIVDVAKHTPGVEWIGYISDDEYRKYLESCCVFAYPSLYEGLGIPVLDALQHGIPVLTSKGSSMEEIVGSAAVLTDPKHIGKISEDLEMLLSDTTLRATLAEKGKQRSVEFSWEKTANLLLESIEKALRS